MRRLEDFVPQNHPLRAVRKMVNLALKNIEPLLSGMYAADIKSGHPAIAPEKLLRAMLLQIFYSIRSERMLMEQTQYNLLFRWFVGLSMDDAVWVPTVFTKNRERLIAHDAVIELFNEVLAIANQNDWLSGEHFSVDGTLIQAWAGVDYDQDRAQASLSNVFVHPDPYAVGRGGSRNPRVLGGDRSQLPQSLWSADLSPLRQAGQAGQPQHQRRQTMAQG